MKTTTFTLFSVCVYSLAFAEGRDGSAEWFSDSVSGLARKEGAAYESFNGISANDVLVLTRANPVEEILSECLKVRPQTAPEVVKRRAWLKEQVAELRRVVVGITRAELEKILVPGFGFTGAHIYHLKKAPFLKVRVEFEPVQRKERPRRDGKDLVKAISKPYVGLLFID